MTTGQIRTEIAEVSEHATVGMLFIDNPERRNAMNAAMYEAVPGAVAQLTADPRLRVVVVQGAGGDAFSAGSDISEFSERRLGPRAEGYDNAEHISWEALAGIDVPVIAAIHGPCRGGGIAIALHCDIRIAAHDATFATPPASIGIAYPAEATQRLVALVGPASAKRMLFTSVVLDAAEAHRIGLADEVLPAAELDDHVAGLARRIAQLAPLSIRAAKLVIDDLATANSELSDVAQAAVRACYGSDDFKEGIQAFADKRRPEFRGR